MTNNATMGKLKFRSAHAVADSLHRDQAVAKQKFLTQYKNYKFRIVANFWYQVFSWIRTMFCLSCFFLWIAVVVGVGPFFERFLGDWNRNLLIFEGWAIVYLLCVYLPLLILWISTLFPTKQSIKEHTTEAHSSVDDKIKTFSVAGHPKEIQELHTRLEKSRKIDACERAHRRADKGSRRLRQIAAHIFTK